MTDGGVGPDFGQWYDQAFDVGVPGNQAFFGRDVLAGLVEGIRDFQQRRQERWEQYRGSGTTLLGCAMWMDDQELLDEISGLEAACVVVRKQPRDRNVQPPDLPRKLRRLAEFNERPGIPTCFFPELEQLTSLVDGKPPVIGPGWTLPEQDATIPTVRTIGFRKGAGNKGALPPILHAKLVLLGRLWEHDEDGFGPADVTRFAPKRLWVGSANFTASSRRSLEFGFWTEDPALLRGAEKFLLKLIATSEALDPDADSHMPERALPDYDDEAMAEWAAELDLGARAEEADDADGYRL